MLSEVASLYPRAGENQWLVSGRTPKLKVAEVINVLFHHIKVDRAKEDEAAPDINCFSE